MKPFWIIAIVGVLAVSCKEKDTIVNADGITTKLPVVWKTSISDDGELAEVSANAALWFPNGSALVAGRKKNQRSLIAVDAATGRKSWEWSDLLGLRQNPSYPDPINIYTNTFHINNEVLYIPFSTSNYAINWATGQTIWKNKVNLSRFGICYGMGDVVFFAGAINPGIINDESVYTRRIGTDGPDRFVAQPTFEHTQPLNDFWAGYIVGCCPFRAASGDTLLSILYNDPYDSKVSSSNSLISLYNVSQRKWVYDRKFVFAKLTGISNVVSNGGIHAPIIHDGRIYFATGRGLACYDPMTGTEIWALSYFEQGFSSFLIVGDKLFANSLDRRSYCFDATSGQQLWRQTGSTGGINTQIAYLNGVIYFLGGGDGKLHALDAQTGKKLWLLDSPDLAGNHGAFFYGMCAAVPPKDGIGKGHIVVTTGINAYGYEAIR